MASTQTQSEIGRLWGNILLSLGALFWLLLVASGLHARTLEQPDMIHLNHALMTIIGGPLAVVLIVAGLILRRRS